MINRIRCLLCAIGLGLTSTPDWAFDQAGHFYMAYALSASATGPDGMPPTDRLLVAFCAQLPDLSQDLDATATYQQAVMGSPWAWLRWATQDVARSDEIRRMITVQHHLHGLTGGRAPAVQAMAMQLTKALRDAYRPAAPTLERAELLCGWGFAIHLLADSLAHERLADVAKSSDQRLMYPTGRGHAADWKDPDYVFCAEYVSVGFDNTVQCRFTEEPGRRFNAWSALWTDRAHDTYDPLGSTVAESRQRLRLAMVALGRQAGPTNYWGENDLRDLLFGKPMQGAWSGWTEDQRQLRGFIEGSGTDRPCEVVLADALQRIKGLRPFAGLSCRGAWQRFQPQVRARLAADTGSVLRAPLGDPFERIYMSDPIVPSSTQRRMR